MVDLPRQWGLCDRPRTWAIIWSLASRHDIVLQNEDGAFFVYPEDHMPVMMYMRGRRDGVGTRAVGGEL